MITTRQINVKLPKRKKELSRVTTKDVDASIRVEMPTGNPIKKPIVTTNKLSDVADIREKKRRDDIAIEKKLMIKDEKKVVQEEKKGPEPSLASLPLPPSPISPEIIITTTKTEKKPWKDMTDEEKKIAYKERAEKAKATREANKKKEEEKK